MENIVYQTHHVYVNTSVNEQNRHEKTLINLDVVKINCKIKKFAMNYLISVLKSKGIIETDTVSGWQVLIAWDAFKSRRKCNY